VAVTEGPTHVIPVKVEDLSSNTIKKLAQGSKGLTAAFNKMQATIISVNQALDLFGRAQAMASRAMTGTVGRAIELEKRVAEVTTLLSDQADAARMLTDEILDLQAQFGTSQADLAKAYYQAISSGAVTATTANDLLIASQKLAIGGVTNLATAVDGLTTIINAYGLRADNAVNVSDALFIGMRAGKTTVDELSNSLGQAAALAATSGVQFQELIGAVSAITTGGVRTAEAVTQVRAAMVGLTKQTEDLQTIFNKLNITSVQAAIKQDGLVGTLKKIIAETDGSTESLTKLFGRIEAVNAILALTSDSIGGKFNAIMSDMGMAATNAGEQTEKAFKKLADTTDFRLNQLAGQTQARLTRIGNVLKEILIPAMEGVLSAIDRLGKAFNALTSALGKIDFAGIAREADIFVIAISTLSAAITAAFTPQIAAQITAFATSLKTLGASILTASAPFAILAAKIAAVTIAITAAVATVDILVRNIKQFPELLTVVGGAFVAWGKRIERFFRGTQLVILQTQTVVLEGLNAIGLASDDVVDRFNRMQVQSANRLQELQGEIDSTDQALSDASKNIDFGLVGKAIEEVTGFLDNFNSKLDESAVKASKIKMPTIPSLPTTMDSATVQPAKSVELPVLFDQKQLDLIEASLNNVFGDTLIGGLEQTVGGAAKSFAGGMSNVASGAMGAVGAAKMIMDAIEGIIDMVLDFPKQIARIITKITDLPTMFFDAVAEIPKALTNFIKNFIPNLVDAALNFADLFIELPEMMNDALTSLVEKLPEIASKFMEGLVKMDLTVIGIKTMAGMIRSVPKLIGALVEQIPIAAQAMADAFVDTIKESINELFKALNLKAPFDLKELEKGLEKMGENIQRSAAKLFEVVDLEAAARGMDVADRIRNAISSSAKKAGNILQQAWDGLVKTWRWIVDNIIQPIWNALTTAWRWIWDTILKPAWEFIKQIFDVVVEAVRGVFVFAEQILQGVFELFRVVVEYGAQLWNGFIETMRGVFDFFVEALQGVFSFARDMFLKAGEGLMHVWGQFTKNIIEPLANLFRSVWDAFNKYIIEPTSQLFMSIWESGKALFTWVVVLFETLWNTVQKIFDDIVKLVSDVFENAKKGLATVFNFFKEIGDGLKSGLQFVVDLFKPIADVFKNFKLEAPKIEVPQLPKLEAPNIEIPTIRIPEPSWLGKLKISKPSWWPAATGGLVIGPNSGPGKKLLDRFNRSDAGKVWNKGAEAVKSVAKRLGFSSGGVVPSGKMIDGVLYAQTGAVAQGTDVVPAMLTPGEFVINAEATKKNFGLLNFMNATKQRVVPNVGDMTINVVVNARTNLTPETIRREVVPAVEKEFKRKSQEGRFVLSASGIR
jgi:TP901 family phage tail tape measure protein